MLINDVYESANILQSIIKDETWQLIDNSTFSCQAFHFHFFICSDSYYCKWLSVLHKLTGQSKILDSAQV